MSKQFLYGLHTVESFLQTSAHDIIEIYIDKARKDDRIQVIERLAEAAGIRCHLADRAYLEKLVETPHHQGVIARVHVRKALNENDLSELLEGIETPFLLILDQVQDPHNLGACLRSADAAGVHAVITARDRSVGLTPIVRKVASGASDHVPFVQVTNLARTLKELKERNIWVLGASEDAEKTVFEADLRGALAIVMGNEGEGLRRLTREHCDSLLRIPLQGSVSSLNVSVATGIFLFEAVRQRSS